MENKEHMCEHTEGCGCEEELETMVLTLDDDTELECGILGIFEMESKEYIALLPVEDETVLIYEYHETEEGISLDLIESDEEFQRVSDAFYDMYGDEEE